MWLWYDEMINLKIVVFINQKLKYDHFINRIAGGNRSCIEKKNNLFWVFNDFFFKFQMSPLNNNTLTSPTSHASSISQHQSQPQQQQQQSHQPQVKKNYAIKI